MTSAHVTEVAKNVRMWKYEYVKIWICKYRTLHKCSKCSTIFNQLGKNTDCCTC